MLHASSSSAVFGCHFSTTVCNIFCVQPLKRRGSQFSKLFIFFTHTSVLHSTVFYQWTVCLESKRKYPDLLKVRNYPWSRETHRCASRILHRVPLVLLCQCEPLYCLLRVCMTSTDRWIVRKERERISRVRRRISCLHLLLILCWIPIHVGPICQRSNSQST